MATLDRIRVEWTGGTGMPGVSTFYALPAATGAVAALTTFFGVVDTYIPGDVTLTIPNSGDSIESTTGELVGDWTSTGGGAVPGLGGGDWAAGVGCRVVWQTSTILSGRRLRGATFLAPLTVAVYDTNGTLDSTIFGILQSAATTLATGSHLVIFSRPSAPGAADGGYGSVVGATIPDRVTSLRSRRY